MSSKTTLSKGTLGLKFMNRAQPSSPASTAEKAKSAKPTTQNATPARAAGQSDSKLNGSVTETQSAPTSSWTDGQWSKRAASTSGPVVVQESSLLAFPLLGGSSSFASTSHSSAQSYYSSMPFTSSVVSGRRSFGGANIEIEQLNDPDRKKKSDSKDEGESGPDRKESNTQRKRRLRREKEEQVLTGRARVIDKTSSKQTNISKDSKGKQKAEPAVLAKDQFARPGGFEGAKKKVKDQGSGKQKGKNQGDVKWNEPGVQREWDKSKAEDSSGDDDQTLDIDEAWDGLKQKLDRGTDDDESTSDSDDSGGLVVTPSTTDAKPTKRELEDAVEQAETRFTGDKKSKGNKKRRR
ncbi:hypothetical protein ACM66B_005414 [Microbotryomycetes sp. NB124-2]